MKQFNIDIDQNSSQIEKVTVNRGEYFCIQTTYRDWTLNKAQANFQFYTEDGKLVETALEMISYDQENNIVVMMHYLDKFESGAKLLLKTNAESIDHPNIWVNVEVACPSLVCNNTVYQQKSISPIVYQPQINSGGVVYLDSMLAKNNTLSVKMGHAGNKAAQIKVLDEQTLSSVFEIKNYTEKLMPTGLVLKTVGSSISMNPDKLMLNGQEVKVKEVTIGEETLSVLQVV